MEHNQINQVMASWLSLTQLQQNIANQLESALQEAHQLSLREYYVLLFLSQSPEKKLRLQHLQEKVGLSQSALSRLVTRLEAKNCGVLKRHICQDDRRGIYTSLSDYGEEKLEKASATFQTIILQEFNNNHIQEELQKLMQQISNESG